MDHVTDTGADRDPLLSLVPPVEEMHRIGPIYDVGTYLGMGRSSLGSLQRLAYLKPEHSVLDIGCGFGRVAIHLAQVLKPQAHYLGLDIVSFEIDWCLQSIGKKYPNFDFRHLDVRNQAYNPGGLESPTAVRFPVPEERKFDLAILFSVFTHMLPADVEAYLAEIHRHLKPGGVLFASYFLLNDRSRPKMEAGAAQFRFLAEDGYYTAEPLVHEAAVAYDEGRALQMHAAAGFAVDKIAYGSWYGRHPADGGQDVIVSTKEA